VSFALRRLILKLSFVFQLCRSKCTKDKQFFLTVISQCFHCLTSALMLEHVLTVIAEITAKIES
jgi:hypothetical protein